MAKSWLMKSEPSVYSIDNLQQDGKTFWDGIRNYQARNFIRDEMRVGDRVLFYHSNSDAVGVAGIARVCAKAYPDFTSWDPQSKYFDPKSSEKEPRWFMVDVEFVEKFPEVVSLARIREVPELQEMILLQRSRLSIQPVSSDEFAIILSMGRGG